MTHLVQGGHLLQETYLEETDESLAARAASDSTALAELYRRHLPGIYQYCRYRLHDPDLAEDVTGQIFMKMVEGLRKNRVDRVRPWLYTIAHHEVVSVYRQRRTDVGLDHVRENPSPMQSPEEIAIDRVDAGAILRLIPKLKPAEREVFELRLAGLTNPEIGQVLGKGHAWVRTTQHRAITRLRALLAERETPEGTR